MTLVRWYPTNSVNVAAQMNRMLEDVFAPSGRPGSGSAWSPHVDVAETKDGYVVVMEAPGMDKDSIKVSLHENTLAIEGEKRREEGKEGVKYHRSERSWGTFHRAFRLPGDLQRDAVSAAYTNGVLRVTVPKAEKARAKEISVKVE